MLNCFKNMSHIFSKKYHSNLEKRILSRCPFKVDLSLSLTALPVCQYILFYVPLPFSHLFRSLCYTNFTWWYSILFLEYIIYISILFNTWITLKLKENSANWNLPHFRLIIFLINCNITEEYYLKYLMTLFLIFYIMLHI